MVECLQCGECCRQFCDGVYAVQEDLLRWVDEGRTDILERFEVLQESGWANASQLGKKDILALTDETFPLVNPKTGRSYRGRCPFLRKRYGKNEYYCRIHPTRPWVCAEYQPWTGGEAPSPTNNPCPLTVPQE